MDEAGQGDPFASPDLWAKSSLLIQNPDPTIPKIPDLGNIRTEWPDLGISLEDGFTFPATSDTNWLGIIPEKPSIEPIEVSSQSSQVDDTWSISTEDVSLPKQPPSRSWEQYADAAFKEPCRYLSEAGVAAFDAALRQISPPKTLGRPVKPHIFLKSLFQLGLGRDSSLFVFQADGTFIIRIADPRMYGLTPDCTRSVIARFGECGTLLRSLKKQIARIYGKQKCPPTSVATARTISSILLELDKQITAKQPIRSLLQLQTAFRLPFMTLGLLRDILSEMAKLNTDQRVLTYLYDLAEEVERSEPCLKPLMAQIIARASEPWLRAVTACVGLRQLDASSETMRTSLAEEAELGEEPDEDEDALFPGWFGIADRTLVRQVFEGMSLLDRQGLSTSRTNTRNEALNWQFSWTGIINEEKRPEQMVVTQMAKLEEPELGLNLGLMDLSPQLDISQALGKTYDLFEGQMMPNKELEMATIIEDLFSGKATAGLTNSPTFAVSASHSFHPILAARARTINHACLRELFDPGLDRKSGRPLHLSYHLSLLNRFLFMSDGMFTTRLSLALFDPELASAERTKGRARFGNMGLRLGSRSTWPPASSELQLALMGILTSAFENDTSTNAITSSPGPAELPGDLSFALRQLSEDEIQRCLDQSSLEALDFLRVQYRPPAPLDAVITPSILQKYDAVQRLLLRMFRLVFVVNHARQRLRRSARTTSKQRGAATKFVHAAHHFVTGFMDYLLNTAIGSNWTQLQRDMSELEAALSTERGDVVETKVEMKMENRGIAYVRALHERTLDSVMFACLLRKRHEKVRVLFEDILRLVLAFAAVQGDVDEATAADMYDGFRKQVGVFIDVCKGLGDRKEYFGKEDAGLRALVTRLTMNDFYSSNLERVLRL